METAHSALVYSWNVLHSVHGANYREPALLRYPNEFERLDKIAQIISHWQVGQRVRICLQEVPGDLVTRLRDRLPNGWSLSCHTSPRVPHLRVNVSHPLHDTRESLVTIGYGDPEKVEGRTFENDTGKGFLACEFEHLVAVINTHLSFGDKRNAQLATLSKYVQSAQIPVVLTGDFNARLHDLLPALAHGARHADLSQQSPTRPSQSSGESDQTIDHFISWRASSISAQVLDGQGLSDHQPIVSAFEWDPEPLQL